MRVRAGWQADLTQSEDAPHTGGQAEDDAALTVLQGRWGCLVDISLEETAGKGSGQVASHDLPPGCQLVGGFARAVENTGEQDHHNSGRLHVEVVAVRLERSFH